MSDPRNIPDWLGPARAFKRDKRRELRIVEKAVDELRRGCAYLPTGSAHVEAMQHHINALKNEMSAVNWGR